MFEIIFDIIGALLSPFIELLAVPVLVIAGVFFLVYLLSSYSAEQEKAKKAEEQEKQNKIRAEQDAKDSKFNEWYNKLVGYYDKINKQIYCGNDFNPGNMYDAIWELEKIQPEDRYTASFNQVFSNHVNWLRKIINFNIECPGYYAVPMILSAVRCLRSAYKNDNGFNPAIDALTKLYKKAQSETFYIKFTQYGDCALNVNQEKMNVIEAKLRRLESNLKGELGEYYENLSPNLAQYIEYSAESMWCIASKKPFDQDAFNLMTQRFNAFTARYLANNYYVTRSNWYEANKNQQNNIQNEHVEQLLALLYAKNLIGGQNTVNQEKDHITSWINNAVYIKKENECFLLASGLAWMGLFELERDVLRQLFEKKVNFEAEHQDRLSFLEGGGTTNIKIYDTSDMDGFLYDSSADGWNNDAYDLFFRKLDMTHKSLDYSLAIAKWTKTLPLASGQKISQEQIEDEFIKLVRDFDGEIVVNKENARAINLANVEYENSFIFRFTSERNRCISILFSSEKYGRNLNTTIITMFTPEDGLSNEQLKKYALAIKDNIYAQSFRESILQVVDEITKEKKTVYDGENVKKPDKKVFS